jgi:hypothetical protein
MAEYSMLRERVVASVAAVSNIPVANFLGS